MIVRDFIVFRATTTEKRIKPTTFKLDKFHFSHYSPKRGDILNSCSCTLIKMYVPPKCWHSFTSFFLPVSQRLNSGLNRLDVEASISHIISYKHSVRYLCTRDQPVADTATYISQNKTLSAGIQPKILIMKRL
jgi:hypothetical protein